MASSIWRAAKLSFLSRPSLCSAGDGRALGAEREPVLAPVRYRAETDVEKSLGGRDRHRRALGECAGRGEEPSVTDRRVVEKGCRRDSRFSSPSSSQPASSSSSSRASPIVKPCIMGQHQPLTACGLPLGSPLGMGLGAARATAGGSRKAAGKDPAVSGLSGVALGLRATRHCSKQGRSVGGVREGDIGAGSARSDMDKRPGAARARASCQGTPRAAAPADRRREGPPLACEGASRRDACRA
jgi:hypothetical protein